MIRPLLIAGTRPEAIKMAPIIQQARHRSDYEPIVCFTGQHREMLAQVADYFEIPPDVDLDVMRPNQTLASLTSRCLTGIDEVISRHQPDCVVAQGDTTTVLTASLAAFYHHLPLIHVEAGLRTGNLQSPWPEEFNRRAAGITAALHCAPTAQARRNLMREGVPSMACPVTGNTVIDALLQAVERERQNDSPWSKKYAFLEDRAMVLITGHRRENFGKKFDGIWTALAQLSSDFPDTVFVYPVHLNPNVRDRVGEFLGGKSNVHLTEPANYPEFVWLMDRSKLIITDSGGVQEEAPSLRKPVLVTRDTTERPEAVDAGAVELVGTYPQAIVDSASLLLRDENEYRTRQIDTNPYGDGKAASRILDEIATRWPSSRENAA